MFGWFRELLEIRYEFRERKLRLSEEASERVNVCASCEVLKAALTRANFEKDQLLNKLLTPDVPAEVPKVLTSVSMPKQMPFAVRRQMLEAEDRVKADTLKRQRIEEEELKNKLSIEKLEKELQINSGGS